MITAKEIAMFFKMLKSDLKRKKGLNVILFIFISVASMLVFSGSVQIFSNFTREATAKRLCKSSDTQFWVLSERFTEGDLGDKVSEALGKEEDVTDWSRTKLARISETAIEYPDIDLHENRYMYMMKIQGLTTMPREHDLVYDLNDRPFYVPNGCIAIPIEVQSTLGVKVGDKVKYTKETGEVYELEICCIFKDNMDNGIVRYIVSDADYEVLTEKHIRSYIVYNICMKNATEDRISEFKEKMYDQDIPVLSISYNTGMSDDVIFMEIISVFVVIVSVFLILIIFMTIRFTMIADLKNEEKEIGMMKALGVDSFSFRWLFAAKYIAFAVIGGIVGIIAGLPVAGAFINMFGPDCILPERWQMILIGIISVIAIIIMMIAFSLIVMRRINKISVIDAIHGENRGERFSKRFPMFLHRRKKMSVPFFIALTDILMRFKRYIFLLISYSLGAVIVLLGFNVRNSVINPKYTQYWLYSSYDFSFNFTSEQLDEIAKEEEKTGKDFYTIVNQKLADADIPAHINSMNTTRGYMKIDDKYENFDVLWKKGEPEKQVYRKGGTAPRLANEAAMSAYTAGKLGINVGDVIKVIINEKNEDRTDYVENERELVITGLTDYMENGDPIIIMGDEYDEGFPQWNYCTGLAIDAPEKEKPAVLAQMRELFGEKQILDGMQALREQVTQFDTLFMLFEYVVGGAIVLILMLITYLYMSIFVAEEVPETALLKSLGFRNISIKAWYLLRMLILLAVSIVLGEIYLWTAGSVFFGSFMTQYEVTGMKLYFELPVSFIVIPLIITAAVLFTTIINLRNIKHIGIWKISEE